MHGMRQSEPCRSNSFQKAGDEASARSEGFSSAAGVADAWHASSTLAVNAASMLCFATYIVLFFEPVHPHGGSRHRVAADPHVVKFVLPDGGSRREGVPDDGLDEAVTLIPKGPASPPQRKARCARRTA